MSTAEKFVRNLLSNWTGMILGLMISFFLSPYVVRKLGNTYYGVWNIIMDMTGYLGLLEMGVRQSIIRYVAKYNAVNEMDSLNRIVSSAFSIYGFTSVACAVISIGLAALFPYVVDVSADTVPIARWVIVITGFSVAQGLIFSVYYGVILGIQRYDVVVKVNMLVSIIKAGLTVALLGNGYGLISLSMMHLVMGFASSMYGRHYCNKEIPGLNIRFGKYASEWYGRIFNYSLKTFMMFIGQKIVYYSDSIVIGILLGPVHVTYFVIGASLTEYMRRIVNQMTQMFTPLTSELQALREEQKIRDVLIQGTKLSLIIALPISIVFLTMGKRFISLWMGKEYGPLSGEVLIVLTIAHLFSIAQYTTQDILQGLNKHQICAVCRCAEAVANLILSIVLIRYWGIVGVAVGTAVPHLATALFAYPYFISREVKVDFKQYVFRSYMAPIISSVPYLICCILIENRFPAGNLAGFFARVLALMPLYLVPVWYFSIRKQERIVYISALYKLVPALNRKPG
ncbi:MAG: hypothetical protein C4529_01775 [Deltaproteobacteria bacterium]|nr:MAG: hypothetical protein C4529_01775 [Deltaproteobacteria bacterium]